MEISTIKAISMSSKEIAEVTGKRHSNVCRDIRQMATQLGIHTDKSIENHEQIEGLTWEYDDRGYIVEYHLNDVLTLTLVAKYQTKLRYAVIKRWKELEEGLAAPTIPHIAPDPRIDVIIDILKTIVEYVTGRQALIDTKQLEEPEEEDAPAQADLDLDNEYYSPTELARMAPFRTNARKINLALTARGLQGKSEGMYVLTEAGEQYGAVVIRQYGRNSARQVRWRKAVLNELV